MNTYRRGKLKESIKSINFLIVHNRFNQYCLKPKLKEREEERKDQRSELPSDINVSCGYSMSSHLCFWHFVVYPFQWFTIFHCGFNFNFPNYGFLFMYFLAIYLTPFYKYLRILFSYWCVRNLIICPLQIIYFLPVFNYFFIFLRMIFFNKF